MNIWRYQIQDLYLFIVIYLILCLIVELFQKVGQSELYNLFTKIRGTQRTQIITEWAITLVSCLGKLFTAIINNRLSLLPDEINLISECQTGFRKGYSTIDNIFSLHAHISLYFSLGKNMFCSSKDFRKAFDSVEKRTLTKLQKFVIHGKCFDFIKNRHRNIKSCAWSQKRLSDLSQRLTGVRQGEKLSLSWFLYFSMTLKNS